MLHLSKQERLVLIVLAAVILTGSVLNYALRTAACFRDLSRFADGDFPPPAPSPQGGGK